MKANFTTWQNLTNTIGARKTGTWDGLFEQFQTPHPFAGTREHPGWSAATFRDDKRAKSNVEAVTAAVLDYDGTETLERAVELWGGLWGCIHTSKSHRPDVHRFRVVLPMRRPVSAYEWELLWPRLNQFADYKLDGQCKDPSRFWFVPARIADSEYRTIRLTGSVLDPDEWLRMPLEKREREPAPVIPIADPSRVEKRARAYIAKMPPAIQGSGGDAQTWRVAIELARGFGLDEQTTFRILWQDYNPRCQPPWSAQELTHKASDAVHKSTAEYGYRLRNDDQWQPPERYYARPEEPHDAWEPPETPPVPEEASTEREQKQNSRLKVFSLQDLFEKVIEEAKTKKPARGLKTGHFQLDKLLCGLRRGNITVLGARTSFGKTSKALHIADLALKDGHEVMYISVEDNEMLCGKRFMAMRANLNALKVRANQCNDRDIEKMINAAVRAEKSPFFVNAIGVPVEEIAKLIREQGGKRNVALVVFDYLQRCNVGREIDRRNELTFISNTLGDAIKGINAAGLLISQLKRPDDKSNKPPTMFDLKESGDIENAAEHIIIGHVREEQTVGRTVKKRQIRVEKNKDGPVFDEWIDLDFDEVTASFKTVMGDARGYNDFDDQFDDGFDS